MIIEAYMQPREIPAPVETSLPNPALLPLPPEPITLQTRWPGLLDTESCGSAASQPLIVEEVELTEVSHARFEAVELGAHVWADGHHAPGQDETVQALAVAQIVVQEISFGCEARGPAHFSCRDEEELPGLVCDEAEVDENLLELFRDHLERQPRFDAPASQGALQASDERAWISEVAAETLEAAGAIQAGEEEQPRSGVPEWALHLEEVNLLETIELQPVDMATRAQAA